MRQRNKWVLNLTNGVLLYAPNRYKYKQLRIRCNDSGGDL